jgi:hypothetical protein
MVLRAAALAKAGVGQLHPTGRQATHSRQNVGGEAAASRRPVNVLSNGSVCSHGPRPPGLAV